MTKKTPAIIADPSSGVSELIGGILMIIVVVAAVALISVVVFSQQTPAEIPNINFMTGTNAAGTTLYLYHNGGDTLRRGEFSVVIDDQAPRTDYTISGGGDEWSVGKNLVLTGITTPPKKVALIYTHGDVDPVVLRSGASSVAVLQNSINPSGAPIIPADLPGYINASDPQVVVNFILANTSIIADAINQSPSTVGPVIADVVGADSINFYRESKTDIDEYTYFLFNITTSGSTFSYDTGTVRNLEVGDIIKIGQVHSNSKSWKIFGLGDQIWELSAGNVDVSWRHKTTGIWENTSSTEIFHSRITGYKDVGSTLTIRTTQNGYYTALVINTTKVIEGIDSHTIVIKDIRPVGIGLFVLEYDHNTNAVYFVGHADSVTWM